MKITNYEFMSRFQAISSRLKESINLGLSTKQTSLNDYFPVFLSTKYFFSIFFIFFLLFENQLIRKKKASLKSGTSAQHYQKCVLYAQSKGYEINLIHQYVKLIFAEDSSNLPRT